MTDAAQLFSRLRGRLTVSCQAPADSPLNEPTIIAAFARAAALRGAAGVRVDTPDRVAAVREALPGVAIVGLWKQQFPGCDVYITPQYCHAEAIARAGADLIAIDATDRDRPEGETVAGIVDAIHHRLQKPVLADIDTYEAAVAAADAGADAVATTLYGYTQATANRTPPGFDLLARLARDFNIPVVCEGGVASPEMAKKAIALGADFAIVGTAITGVDRLTAAYVRAL